MKEIVVIAPILDVYQKASELVQEYQYSNVEVVMGSMSEGLRVARKAIQQGANIVVTRGGTYQMVKSEVNVPSVEIKVSAYDIIESFQRVENLAGTIGVVGYNNVVYGFDILQKILHYDVVKIELKQESDIYRVIEEHKKMGIKTYIGDANITRIIEGLDCHGILIHSQKDSILTAIQEARRISRATKEEKRRAQQITTMTDFVHDAIIAIDENERITVFNTAAEQIFGVSKANALNKNVARVVTGSKLPEVLHTGKRQIGQVQNIGEAKIATNRIPIVVDGKVKGAVATFQDITEMQYIEQKVRRTLYEKGFAAKYTFEDIIGDSPEIAECIRIAKEYAQYDTPVHICGESGVGKELFCQSMHNASPRHNGPFIAINCAAIPPSLIESEFFGYDEGSFTGAKRKGKLGVFELAHNGTLFLDEISEIPKELQGRLLRVLQEKQVMRVGGDKIIPVDVKIITASNRYLKKMVQEEKFRKDLYFRINVLSLRIPPLERRQQDILALAQHFVQKYSKKYNKPAPILTPQIQESLMQRCYEGNARELEGMMERCVIVGSFDSLTEKSHFPTATPPTPQFREALPLKEMEKRYIVEIYNNTDKNIQKTCEILNINRTTLWRKLKEQDELV